MKYDLIIFDCDGTLVDTEVPVNEAFIHSLHQLAPPDYKKFDVPYILEKCIGGTVHSIFDQMAKDVNNVISPEMRAKVITDYQDLIPAYLKTHVKPDPTLINILQNLSAHFKICVASNGLPRNVANSLHAAGLSEIFGQNIFTPANVKNPKPAPDLILYAAQQMGVTDMSRVLHIEDAVRGAMAGLSAKANVIGFTGHTTEKTKTIAELKHAGVIEVFDNWPNVAKFILR